MAVPELLRPQYLLTPPLTLCARGLEPVEKLVKDQLIEGEMARKSQYDQGYSLWLSRVQGNLVCCYWRRPILHKRRSNNHDPFAVAVVRSGVIVGHVPRKIYSMF